MSSTFLSVPLGPVVGQSAIVNYRKPSATIPHGPDHAVYVQRYLMVSKSSNLACFVAWEIGGSLGQQGLSMSAP